MSFQEQAIRIRCQDSWLYGILSIPQRPIARGVLIAVGGPQYRVGSHRQFVLLARYLAMQDIPVMRFDFRGMGDSGGGVRTFENVEVDLCNAVDYFFRECVFLQDVVVWGLCDAASAALFYAHKDKRIGGLVLLNPWVRTEHGIAKAYLKHYYLTRLYKLEFRKKLAGGQFNLAASIRAFCGIIISVFPGKKDTENTGIIKDRNGSLFHQTPLPDRMLEGLKCFQGKTLVITSGDDFTAREFLDLLDSSMDWQETLEAKQVDFSHLQDANHTFATRQWRDQVAELTKNWVRSW
jgi:uncharacterized protein